MPRRPHATAALIACLAIGAAAGCAGPDLTKAAFGRTTIPATAATPSGSTATGAVGEPTDPAFTVAKLRAIEPCKLFDEQTLGSLGTPISSPSPGIDDCFAVLRDRSGESLSVSVDLGESVLSGVDGATRQLAGLPLSERKLPQSDACFETVITNKSPELGITVQTGYSAGEPCRPARTVLERVVQRLRTNPPVRANLPGSIATLDPCQLLGTAEAGSILGGEPAVSTHGLRMCNWRGAGAEASVQFDLGYDPSNSTTEEKPKPVKIGDVTAYQNVTDYGRLSCELTWAHRPVDREFEIVRIKFSDSSAGEEKACGAARQLAEKVQPLLPKP